MAFSCSWPVLLLFFIHFLHVNLLVYIIFLAGSAAVSHTFSIHQSPCIHHVSSRFYSCCSYIFFTSVSLYTSCFWQVLLLFPIHFPHISLLVYIMFLAGSMAVPHTFTSHQSHSIHHVSSRFYGCSSYIFFTSISLYTPVKTSTMASWMASTWS